MPIYAYRCESCGFAKDVLQKLSDLPLTDCPTCGVGAFKKQLTAAGFQLKGTGWYATDFKGGAVKTDSSEKTQEPSSASTTATDASPAKTIAAKTDAAPVSAAGGCGGGCACH